MPKFPNPPGVPQLVALGVLPNEQRAVAAGTVLWRLYFQGGRHPTRWHDFRCFGPTGGRFDHHDPPPQLQNRGILYAAQSGPVCVAEVYQQTRTINRRRRNPWLAAFALARDVLLLDMSSGWPTRATASQAINSGSRVRARRWSRQIYQAFPNIEGIYYPSSMYMNALAVAFYERATNAIPTAPVFHRALNDPALLTSLQNVAATVGYRLI
jgi:hypothetical protein